MKLRRMATQDDSQNSVDRRVRTSRWNVRLSDNGFNTEAPRREGRQVGDGRMKGVADPESLRGRTIVRAKQSGLEEAKLRPWQSHSRLDDFRQQLRAPPGLASRVRGPRETGRCRRTASEAPASTRRRRDRAFRHANRQLPGKGWEVIAREPEAISREYQLLRHEHCLREAPFSAALRDLGASASTALQPEG